MRVPESGKENAMNCNRKLTAFSKDAVGRTNDVKPTETCKYPPTDEICFLLFEMRFTPGLCDEGFSQQQLNGILHGNVTVIRLRDGLRGCFAGQWRLLDGHGAVLAAGELSGTVGAGTHRPPGADPCEHCSIPPHYEGRLTGQVMVRGEFEGAEVCATLAGTGPLEGATDQRMSIEGVLISPCTQ
jgi:hypothetical protein